MVEDGSCCSSVGMVSSGGSASPEPSSAEQATSTKRPMQAPSRERRRANDEPIQSLPTCSPLTISAVGVLDTYVPELYFQLVQ